MLGTRRPKNQSGRKDGTAGDYFMTDTGWCFVVVVLFCLEKKCLRYPRSGDEGSIQA